MTDYLDEYIKAILDAYSNLHIEMLMFTLDNCQMKDGSNIDEKIADEAHRELCCLKKRIEEINRIYNISSYEKGGRINGNINRFCTTSADVPDNGYSRGDD